jgi:hypothetical protein
MYFEIVGELTNVETIAHGRGVRSRQSLRKKYGVGNWRKRKAIARVRLKSGMERLAEVQWHEAHGIGKKDFKIKKFVD